MRRLLLSAALVAAVAAVIVFGVGAGPAPNQDPTYKIELDNAFGLVTGAAFKVAGVPAGTIQAINLDQRTLRAVVTVQVNNLGLASFHQSATCDSQPQSLIGEYFISCDPGTSGPMLKSGATIPVTHTHSTIPADLLLNILRAPERERLALIINSLGAGVAARSTDLQQALDRAVPALTETDNLLALLRNDSATITDLTHNANTVVSALADNSVQVQRFLDAADRAASATATQNANLRSTLAELPGFLAQLRPAMARLGQATQANLPAVENLNAASRNLARLFRDLPGFAGASKPALAALGKASVTGRTAVIAARPTVAELQKFARHTPELAKNLSIVLPDLDSTARATERNPRSPGGKGYSGLQALLQFAFNLAVATNYYGPTGHQLAVDAFLSLMCGNYATPASIAQSLAQYGSAYRSCYSWLGPTQPGVNTTDPSAPSACVPDPGGEPGNMPKDTALSSPCTLRASVRRTGHVKAKAGPVSPAAGNTSSTPLSSLPNQLQQGLGGAINGAASTVTGTLSGVSQTIGQVLSLLGSGQGAKVTGPSTPTTPSPATGPSTGTSTSQSLLQYLLGP